MLLRLIKRRMLLFFIWFFTAAHAAQPISLDIDNANLADTIHHLARFLHLNIIISPAVAGYATLHLHHASPEHALDLLLASHGLAKWRIGNIWFIGPQEELIKRRQEEAKWHDICEEADPLITHVWQLKYAKAEDIARLLHDEHASLFSKRGNVHVDIRTNSICIRDIRDRMIDMQRLILSLDVPVQQVLIEARLASVDSDCERELGVIFGIKEKHTGEENYPYLSRNREVGSYSIAIAKLADSSLLDVKLSALEDAGHAELISSPSLFTANQQPAAIEAGEEVPYQEVSEGGGTAVTFKKAVLGLRVIPQVLPGNKVLLQLQINQDRPSNRLVLGVPTISTRQITTNVLVRTGQTIVLGGIYECNNENGEQRIPFISQVPLIGLLFKQQKTRMNKRELLIFVTPKIMTET